MLLNFNIAMQVMIWPLSLVFVFKIISTFIGQNPELIITLFILLIIPSAILLVLTGEQCKNSLTRARFELASSGF